MRTSSKNRYGRHLVISLVGAILVMAWAGASGISLLEGSQAAAGSVSALLAAPTASATPSPSPGFEHCTINLSASTFTVNEDAGQLIIGVNRTCDDLRESKVDFFTQGGSAISNADFSRASGRVDFAAGQTSKTIALTIINDAGGEPSESFSLVLTDPGGSSRLISPSSAVISILDNDAGAPPPPTPSPSPSVSPSPTPSPIPTPGLEHCSIRLSNASFTVSEGVGQVVVGVNRTCDRIRESKVDFFTRGASATSGSDFTARSGRVDFADGETNKTITLTILEDTNGEASESFNLFLTDPGGSAMLVNPASALITITDNDGGGPTPGPTPNPTPSPAPTPSPSPRAEHCQIRLNAASFSVAEDAGQLLVTVNRACDELRESKVDFFTRFGTASDRSDFTYAAGRLFFAPGEVSKDIRLLVTDDVLVEGNETFSLSLTDAGGSAALVAPGSAVITIVDNDVAAPTSNPADQAQFFVKQHYADFLNRDADQNGLNYWSGRITECGNNEDCIRDRRIGVSAAFFVEAEFQETGNYVYRLYKGSFNRKPNYDEFMPDRGRLIEGNDVAGGKVRLSDDWVVRPEFLERYPTSMSAFEFVNRLMDNAGLMPYVDDRNRLVNDMFNGKTRSQVLREVVEFPELRQREYNSAFVLMQYFGYLRRDADQGGYDFWLNVLDNRVPNNHRSMVCAFLTSAEMQERFSSLRTRTDGECGP